LRKYSKGNPCCGILLIYIKGPKETGNKESLYRQPQGGKQQKRKKKPIYLKRLMTSKKRGWSRLKGHRKNR
jgi:hypothetical protein